MDGERLFASLSCNACHNSRPDARGPNLVNVYGSQLALANGQTVTADDAYLRQAILNPSQHITQGYTPIMPTYQGQVSEEGVIALVEFIKNLTPTTVLQRLLTPQICAESAKASRRLWANHPLRRRRSSHERCHHRHSSRSVNGQDSEDELPDQGERPAELASHRRPQADRHAVPDLNYIFLLHRRGPSRTDPPGTADAAKRPDGRRHL